MLDLMQALFAAREAAAAAGDPCAGLCTLASVDAQGEPQARTLVLRALDHRLAIFVNDTSPKWREFSHTDTVSVLVWLPSQQAQFRLQVRLVDVPKEIVDGSWLQRPDTPKRLDWFYEQEQSQSSRLSEPATLAERLLERDPGVPAAAPASARGLYLEPVKIERLLLNNTGSPHQREVQILGETPSSHALVP